MNINKLFHFFFIDLQGLGIICGLIIGLAGIIVQLYLNNEAKQNLIYQTAPEIDCYHINKKIVLENVGFLECDNIWVSEEIYAVSDSFVALVEDAPHFNYYIYNGSKDKMFDLPKGNKKELLLDSLQFRCFSHLLDKYNCKIVSKWKISFEKKGALKKYFYEKEFVFDQSKDKLIPINEYIGGIRIHESMKNYYENGSIHKIKLFFVTMDFEIDPPDAFIILENSSISPLSENCKLSPDIVKQIKLVFLGNSEIHPTDDSCKGYCKYEWQTNSDGAWKKAIHIWGGATIYSNFQGKFTNYLTLEANDYLNANPELLSKIIITDRALYKYNNNKFENINNDELYSILYPARKLYYEKLGFVKKRQYLVGPKTEFQRFMVKGLGSN